MTGTEAYDMLRVCPEKFRPGRIGMSLRLKVDANLEERLKDFCSSEGLVQHVLLTKLLEPVLVEFLSGKERSGSDPETSEPIRSEPKAPGRVGKAPTRKLPKRKLTAADLVDLSDKEKWAVISSSDAKLSDDAIELLADFSASNSEPDEDDFDEDPE